MGCAREPQTAPATFGPAEPNVRLLKVSPRRAGGGPMSGYSPHTAADRRRMLAAVGVERLEDLFAPIDPSLRDFALDVPPALAEADLQRAARELAAENLDTLSHPCFLGAGIYQRWIPAAVGAITSRGEFLTSYTPYQPELSQGTLQVMYEFQTMIAELAGLDVSNASLYDGSTALAEAVTMARAITGRPRTLVPRTVHPHYRAVLATYGLPFDELPVDLPGRLTLDPTTVREALRDDVAAVVIQSPNFLGALEDGEAVAAAAHEAGALLVAGFDPIGAGILAPPGEYGADVAFGEGQSLGVPPSFGGPALGLIATRTRHLRHLPGRIAGAARDNRGQDGFVLTLQAREQHIRRERASSNICTNEALCALAATVYLSLLGKEGLRELATTCAQRAHYAARRVAALPGYRVVDRAPFFQEFVVECPADPIAINEGLAARGIIGGYPLGDDYPELPRCMLVCVTEQQTREDIDRLVDILGRSL